MKVEAEVEILLEGLELVLIADAELELFEAGAKLNIFVP